MCEPPRNIGPDPTGRRSANPAQCLRGGLGDQVGRGDDSLTRCGSEPITISASPVVAIGANASDKALPRRRVLGWSSRPTFSIPSMRTLGWSLVGAATTCGPAFDVSSV